METHTIKNVIIAVNGKQIASLPEAIVNLSLNRIEVTIDEVLLSNETIGLHELAHSLKEFDVSGRVNDKTLIVEKAKVSRLTFDAKQGEAALLRNISILGLRARWDLEK